MQQGRVLRTALVCLLLCGVLFFLFCHWAVPQSGHGNWWPASSAPASAQGLGGSNRPIITEKLPPLPEQVWPAQGPGPVPDDDLTVGTAATDELDPWGSPTGEQNRVAFVSKGIDSDQDGRIDPQLPDNPNFNIWIMRPDGSEQTQITDTAADEREPAYDPSGNLFAFSSNATGTWQIYIVEIRSGVITQVTTGPGNKRHPTWSPDTNWIAFQSDVNGNWDIFKMRSTGVGQPLQLTVNPGDDTDPAWSPWRDEIVFTAEVDSVKRIYLMDADGQNLTALSDGGGDPLANDQEPAWQANATTIAFASDRLTETGDTIRNFNIWRMGASGETGGPAAVLISDLSAASNGNNTNPTWTAGASRQPIRVIYQSNRAADGGPGTQTNEDLWATFFTDTRPPELLEIPSVDNRQPAPNAEITVYAKVFDKDSGVASVRAYFKDPNLKIYSTYTTRFDTNFDDGERYLEIDCARVGSTELFDDGDPANGDAQAGDGIFSGKWTTEDTPHDYIIDIEVTDNAANSLTYDDIYGFSTEVFAPTGNLLFVDDYCEGQEYIGRLGYNNDYPAGYPVESYYLRNPGDYPDIFNIDYDTMAGPYDEPYDIWRIISRGRIPPSVYQYYLPTVEYQLDPSEAVADPENAQPTREVLVVRRGIVWAAPHTGDVWTGPNSGSLVDAASQADLASFLDRGGRLFISGEDIAWALTMAGTTTNSFLTNYLQADYVADVGGGYGFTLSGDGGPVTGATWACYDSDDAPNSLQTPAIESDGPNWQDAADWSNRPDVIRVLGNATTIYTYSGGGAAGLMYADSTTGAHLVYLAFGLEEINRGYHTVDEYSHCKNHRSHLICNTFIWARTASFQGRVLALEGGQALHNPEPIVRAIQGGEVKYAVRCQDDGTWIMNGVPTGSYTLEAFRPGYEIDHYEGSFTHPAMGAVVQDFALKRAEPGAIAGVVTSEATGEFVANVEVTVYEAVPIEEEEEGTGPAQVDEDEYERGEEKGSALTAADGTYDIGGLAPGYYFVEADGAAVGYGSEERLVEVTTGNVTRADFVLTAGDGIIRVTVQDAQTLLAIPGAVVEVLLEGSVVEKGTTDSNGQVEISVQPGTYEVEAEACGYERSATVSATVESSKTTGISIQIEQQPPGSISGRVVSATTGQPVGDVLVRLLYEEDVLDTTTSAGTFTDPGDGTEPYNFIFQDVPTGTMTIRPDPVGLTAQPRERIIRVVSGQRSTGANFQLAALYTFPAGLRMMSVPFGYETTDPATLLQVPPGELLLATWQPERNRYRVYPNAPADRLRLGHGYWLKLDDAADLRQEGSRPPDPTLIELVDGWNMIGDPFDEVIDLYSIQVEDQTETVQSFWAAVSAGKVDGSLFAYILGGYRAVSALSPYAGYWLQAHEDLTLHVNRPAGALSVEEARQRPAVPVPADGWLLPLEVSAAGCVDASTYLGQAASATVGYDPGQDLGKPPAMDFGPYVYAAFEHDPGSNYAVDIQPEGPQTWTLAVHTNMMQTPVTLRWPDMTSVPDDVRLVLVDKAADRRLYMRTASGYQYTACQPVRHLQIVAEDTGRRGELVISGLNVTTASSSGGGPTMIYTLSQPAQVWIEVRNISGVLVRQLRAGQSQPAGQQTVLWNTRNQTGALVPSGQYLLQVTAIAEDGQRNTVLSSFLLHR